MKSPSDPCPTASGRYTCDFAAGHGGPCETSEPATPWVGPAQSLAKLEAARALAADLDARHRRALLELRSLSAPPPPAPEEEAA